MSPVHGKGDAIGKHRGERGLDCRLDPIRQYSLVRHLCHQARFERRAQRLRLRRKRLTLHLNHLLHRDHVVIEMSHDPQ